MKEIFGGLDHLLEKSYLSLLFFSRFFGESIALLSTVFAEEPLAGERLEVLRLLYGFRFGSSKQRAKSLGKKQGLDG